MITVVQANQIYDILEQFGAASTYREDYVHLAMTEELREYRFQGVFGFGGKVRNDHGHFRVDYYPEDRTTVRDLALKEVNAKLVKLTCNRTACGNFLKRHYKIWNQPSTGDPRYYCIPCGRRISQENPTLQVEIVEVP